jgi:ComF family protein
VLALALAPPCVSCRRPLDAPTRGPVCDRCWSSAPLTAPLLPSSLAIPWGQAAGEYDGTLRDIIHAFKYEGRRSLAGPLSALMREAASRLLQDASCAVPVPLHPWRRTRRGFNQARDLACGLGLPVVPALWKPHATAQQMGLSAEARTHNVRGAIRLSPLIRASTLHRVVRGRIVVLVDDVRTTGATLDTCAEVLRDAGAREVRAVTVAFASRP